MSDLRTLFIYLFNFPLEFTNIFQMFYEELEDLTMLKNLLENIKLLYLLYFISKQLLILGIIVCI